MSSGSHIITSKVVPDSTYGRQGLPDESKHIDAMDVIREFQDLRPGPVNFRLNGADGTFVRQGIDREGFFVVQMWDRGWRNLTKDKYEV